MVFSICVRSAGASSLGIDPPSGIAVGSAWGNAGAEDNGLAERVTSRLGAARNVVSNDTRTECAAARSHGAGRGGGIRTHDADPPKIRLWPLSYTPSRRED